MAEKETASQFNDEKDMHLLKDSIKKNLAMVEISFC